MAKLPDPTELIGPGQAEPLDKEQLEKVIWDQCPNCESLRAELAAVETLNQAAKDELERVRGLVLDARTEYEINNDVVAAMDILRRIQGGEK